MESKYPESPKLSSEYLKRALPLMKQLEAPINPANYAIFYTYVAGKNNELHNEIEKLIHSGNRITRKQSDILYDKYFGNGFEKNIYVQQTNLCKILSDIIKVIVTAEKDATKYGCVLNDYCNELGGINNGASLQLAVDNILLETQLMRASNAGVQKKLNASKQKVEQVKQKLEDARQQANIDQLTGLPTRNVFTSHLNMAITERQPENSSCLLFLDIDHFKKINETYGHVFGDRMLEMVGMALKKGVKGKDTPCRYGGEEFAIFLPDTTIEGATKLAESIRKTIENGKIKRNSDEKTTGNITISIGVAALRENESADEFIQRADDALHLSKANGRNQVTAAK